MKGDREPHIWEDGQRVDWYIYHPTAYDYNLISDTVEDYISMYADQDYRFDSGMEMGENNTIYEVVLQRKRQNGLFF